MTGEGSSQPSAEITPHGVEHLRAFLEDHDDALALEVTYTDDGERTRLVADMRLLERTLDRPAAKPTVACRPLPPTTEDWHVAIDDIQHVATAEPPAVMFDTDADTPRARAEALRGLASVAPSEVTVEEVIDVLTTPEPPHGAPPHSDALDALGQLLEERPDDCAAQLPTLAEHLESTTDETVRVAVLEAMANVGEHRPADLAPYADAAVPYLTADNEAARARAAHCISNIAAHDAADARDAVADLERHVDDRSPGLAYSIYALNSIAEDHPEAVEPAVETLAAVLSDPECADGIRLNASSTIGRIASESPEAAVGTIETVGSLLAAENDRLRANAAGILGDIAKARSDLVVDHADGLGALLDAEDDHSISNAASALARVAEVAPERVERYSDRFRALLGHDHEIVRLNACWALGHVGNEEAIERLEERRTADDSERVRERAQWAIAELESGERS